MTVKTLQVSEIQFETYRNMYRTCLITRSGKVWPGHDLTVLLDNYAEKYEGKILAGDDSKVSDICTSYESKIDSKNQVKDALGYSVFLYCKSKREYLNNNHEKALSDISDALYYFGVACGLNPSVQNINSPLSDSENIVNKNDDVELSNKKIKEEIIAFLRENKEKYHWETYKDAYKDIVKMLSDKASDSNFTFTPITLFNITYWGNPNQSDRDKNFLNKLAEIFSTPKYK